MLKRGFPRFPAFNQHLRVEVAALRNRLLLTAQGAILGMALACVVASSAGSRAQGLAEHRASATQLPANAVRQIAVTVDDLPTASVLGYELAAAERTTRDLIAVFRAHRIPAIGFVNEGKLYAMGRVDPKRVALLERWIAAGLDLGNHTRSHIDLHTTPVEQFGRDLLDGEKVTRALLEKAGRRLSYFRHPFLHTGRSKEVRTRLDTFLGEQGYIVAPVTIDNYDYVFAAAYDRAGAAGNGPAQLKIADAYVEYMQEVVKYYEQQSAAIVGREIVQTLLIHANALNAGAFHRLASWLEERGYRFVSLGKALEDPAYASADAYYGPAGITWLHRWALTQGRSGTVLAGEPVVPEWVERASRAGR